MPLAAKEHGHDVIDAFLWGLLPDNEAVLRRWGSRFQVSARNAYALIAHVGEDCAGAVRFVRPERLAEAGTPPTGIQVEWLDEADVASRLLPGFGALGGVASAGENRAKWTQGPAPCRPRRSEATARASVSRVT